jgi:hypothetical protein
MPAVFVEVNIDAASAQRRRSSLQILDAQRLRGLGAVSAVSPPSVGAPSGWRSSRTKPQRARPRARSQWAGPNPRIRFRTVEVREVLARF